MAVVGVNRKLKIEIEQSETAVRYRNCVLNVNVSHTFGLPHRTLLGAFHFSCCPPTVSVFLTEFVMFSVVPCAIIS